MAQGISQLPFSSSVIESPAMLQIRMISGGVMSIPVHEIDDVMGLKRHLNRLHGFPLGFRQRFLLDGKTLPENVKLDSPMCLDLVLLQFAEVSQEQVDDLVDAAARGSVEEVESKLQVPQDPDSSLADGRTALMEASRAGHAQVLRLLLEAGADKDAADDHGVTSLMYAAQSGRAQIVNLLLEAGADKDAQDDEGSTALMVAAASADMRSPIWFEFGQGRAHVVSLLLRAGVDKDIQDNSGRTALMDASGRGHPDVVSLLLEAGADKDVADNEGFTAINMAYSPTILGLLE